MHQSELEAKLTWASVKRGKALTRFTNSFGFTCLENWSEFLTTITKRRMQNWCKSVFLSTQSWPPIFLPFSTRSSSLRRCHQVLSSPRNTTKRCPVLCRSSFFPFVLVWYFSSACCISRAWWTMARLLLQLFLQSKSLDIHLVNNITFNITLRLTQWRDKTILVTM